MCHSFFLFIRAMHLRFKLHFAVWNKISHFIYFVRLTQIDVIISENEPKTYFDGFEWVWTDWSIDWFIDLLKSNS